MDKYMFRVNNEMLPTASVVLLNFDPTCLLIRLKGACPDEIK